MHRRQTISKQQPIEDFLQIAARRFNIEQRYYSQPIEKTRLPEQFVRRMRLVPYLTHAVGYVFPVSVS
jgi:hypothetical protein